MKTSQLPIVKWLKWSRDEVTSWSIQKYTLNELQQTSFYLITNQYELEEHYNQSSYSDCQQSSNKREEKIKNAVLITIE